MAAPQMGPRPGIYIIHLAAIFQLTVELGRGVGGGLAGGLLTAALWTKPLLRRRRRPVGLSEKGLF